MTDDQDRAGVRALGWSIRSSSVMHDSPWFRIRQDAITLPDGADRTYTYVDHPGSVFVVPQLTDGRILLIKSYRYTLDDWCWEVPAGGLGDKDGAGPEEVARQELAEEAGASCQSLIDLGRFALGNGFARHQARFYLGIGTTIHSAPTLEDLEVIERTEAFTLEDVLSMIDRGEFADGDSALAVLLAARHLANHAPKGAS